MVLLDEATALRSVVSPGRSSSRALSMASAARNRSSASSGWPCSSSTEPMLLFADASSSRQSTFVGSMATSRSASRRYSRKCTSAVVQPPLAPLDEPDPEVALRQVEQPLPVVRVAAGEDFGQRERLGERLLRVGQPALRDPHVADLVERRGAIGQLVVGERLTRGRPRSSPSPSPPTSSRISSRPDRLELLSQVADHEPDQVFGLAAAPVRLAPRRDGRRPLALEIHEVLRHGEQRHERAPPP